MKVKDLRKRRAVSAVVAAVILFTIIFSVGFGYFYNTAQFQNNYQDSLKAENNARLAKSAEDFSVSGSISPGSGFLEFFVNNTGPAITIVDYWIYSGSSAIVLVYQNLTANPTFIRQGGSALFTTTIIDTNATQVFMFKVLSSQGNVQVATYPNSVSNSAINQAFAGGVGWIQMSFSSFQWYSYITGPPQSDIDYDFENLCSNGNQCTGSNYVVDINNPHSGSIIPQGNNETTWSGCGQAYCGSGVPIVFSVNVTNYDARKSTVVIGSDSNLWVMETCDTASNLGGCTQGVPFYVFYIMKVNPTTGAVTTLNQGSFTPIVLPYGQSVTLYYGAVGDLSDASFTSMLLSSDDSLYAGNNLAYYGEFAVFLLFSGTRIPPTSIQLYGQNVPFESAISSDNLGWIQQDPSTCTSGVPTIFTLQVNNSIFSVASINQVVLNATAFSSIVLASAPSGWNEANSGGTITWSNSGGGIANGASQDFIWDGIAPTLNTASQQIIPITLTWASGGFTVLQQSAACMDNASSFLRPPTLPSGIVHYVPIILTNLQTGPVVGGSQVMINVNWNTYSTYLDNPVDNVLFFDFSANSLNAWMESGTARTSTSSVVWVQLNSSGILPISSTTIYMGFYATGTSHLSATGPFGEAPQLTGTYGQYDDGPSVFNYYNNGESIGGFGTVQNGGTLSTTTVTNPFGSNTPVITLTGKGSTSTSSETVVWLTSPVTGNNFVQEGWVNINLNKVGMFAFRGSSSSTLTNYVAGNGWSGSAASIAYESGHTNNVLANTGSKISGWNWVQVAVSGTSYTATIYPTLPDTGGTASSTVTTSDPTLPASNTYLGIATGASSTSSAYFFQWRVRINPPSGQMPFATFGSLV